MGLRALLHPQQPASHHWPCVQIAFPRVHSVPADPLFCHIKWHLRACAKNGNTSPDLPETPDKHRLLSGQTLYSILGD